MEVRYYEYHKQLEKYRSIIETALISSFTGSDKLNQAARYAITGGKMLRGILTLEIGFLYGSRLETSLAAATAVEMVHSFSLIHDDLPCMDDDNFRRGKPSCHKEFGEAAALLAGDYLLARALEISPGLAQSAIEIIKGQSLEAEYEADGYVTASDLYKMYELKTAALFKAACGILSKKSEASEYGYNFGMAFQITDDLLDLKTEKPGKKTLPMIIGEEEARAKAAEYAEKAVEIAKSITEGPYTGILVDLAMNLTDRRV